MTMTNPLEQIRELAEKWQNPKGNSDIHLAGIICGNEILKILDASQGYVCVPVETIQQDAEDSHAFQNFHRALCERFGYTHDLVDWRRDQVSLIEHIAAQLKQNAEDAKRLKALERAMDEKCESEFGHLDPLGWIKRRADEILREGEGL